MEFQGLVWAGLSVEDMDRQIAFYRDAVGLKLLRQGGEGAARWAHFSAGSGGLFELSAGGKASASEKGADQQSLSVGFLVDNLDEVMSLMERNGVRFSGEISEFRSQRWVYFLDAENNRLEIKEVNTHLTG